MSSYLSWKYFLWQVRTNKSHFEDIPKEKGEKTKMKVQKIRRMFLLLSIVHRGARNHTAIVKIKNGRKEPHNMALGRTCCLSTKSEQLKSWKHVELREREESREGWQNGRSKWIVKNRRRGRYSTAAVVGEEFRWFCPLPCSLWQVCGRQSDDDYPLCPWTCDHVHLLPPGSPCQMHFQKNCPVEDNDILELISVLT